MRIQTERVGQEVILLPESEKLIVDLSTLKNLPVAAPLIFTEEKPGGLTVKKRPDGLIEIESRRDTIRIRSDTECNHTVADTQVGSKEIQGRSGYIIGLIFLFFASIGIFLKR